MKTKTLFSTLALLCGTLFPMTIQAAPKPRSDPRPRAVSVSTRDLFYFRRDDTAPGGVTRITLGTGRVAAKPVSQNVFGNFVENLNVVIDDNLWADALHNGNLERIEKANLEPPYWDRTGTAAWQEAPGSGYLSPRDVRLSGPDGTLSQRVYLLVYRVRGYTLTLWMRTPAEAAAWVRYCDTKGLRVPLWEIGNELYGGWQIGHTDAAGNAARFVAFRDAMKQADPSIQVMARRRGSADQRLRPRLQRCIHLHRPWDCG